MWCFDIGFKTMEAMKDHNGVPNGIPEGLFQDGLLNLHITKRPTAVKALPWPGSYSTLLIDYHSLLHRKPSASSSFYSTSSDQSFAKSDRLSRPLVMCTMLCPQWVFEGGTQEAWACRLRPSGTSRVATTCDKSCDPCPSVVQVRGLPQQGLPPPGTHCTPHCPRPQINTDRDERRQSTPNRKARKSSSLHSEALGYGSPWTAGPSSICYARLCSSVPA